MTAMTTDTLPGTQERAVRVEVSAAERAALRGALARLVGLQAPELTPLRRIREEADAVVLTYGVPAGAVSWTDLLARRPPTVAENIAMGLAVCGALVALHSERLSHGGLAAERVLVGPAGRIEVTDVGIGWQPSIPPSQAAAADIAALAELLAPGFAAGTVGAEVALLLVRAADPEPALRPTAAEVAAVLERQCAPVAVLPAKYAAAELSQPAARAATASSVTTASAAGRRPPAPLPNRSAPDLKLPDRSVPDRSVPDRSVPDRSVPDRSVPDRSGPARSADAWAATDDPPTGPHASRRRPVLSLPRLRQLLLVVALAVGAGLVVAGAAQLLADTLSPRPPAMTMPDASAPSGAAEPAPAEVVPPATVRSPPPSVSPPRRPDWSRLVRRLDAKRAAAMATGSRSALAAVDDPSGPAYRRDLVAMRSRAGLVLVGGALSLRSVRLLRAGRHRAEVEVIDTREPYRLLRPDGSRVQRRPERPARAWQVSLVDGRHGWRYLDVTVSGTAAADPGSRR